MSLGEAAIVRLPVVGDRLYEWALPRKNSLTGAGLLMEVADHSFPSVTSNSSAFPVNLKPKPTCCWGINWSLFVVERFQISG